MNRFYFIEKNLITQLDNAIKDFNGRVCLVVVAPIKSKENVISLNIENERGEMKAPNNYNGFLLEGDLAFFNFRDIALSLGVTEFRNSQDLTDFLEKNNLEIYHGN
jgi:hypothetical protein